MLVPADYVDSVRAGGGTPLLIPPLGPGDDAAAIVHRLDGLVLAGGADVNPSRYSEEPDPATISWRDDRDVSEMALLNAADDLGLPVLGICRGMQVMAVTAGGALLQHVPDVIGHRRTLPRRRCLRRDRGAHHRRVRSWRGILGDTFTVACHHHQSVADHPGFDGVAYSADGVLEAMEITGPAVPAWLSSGTPKPSRANTFPGIRGRGRTIHR